IYQRVLAVREKTLGPNHPDVAQTLNNLANVYQSESKHARAEDLYRRAIAICEKALGPGHPDVAAILDNLAGVYQSEASTHKQRASFSARSRFARRHFAPTIPTWLIR